MTHFGSFMNDTLCTDFFLSRGVHLAGCASLIVNEKLFHAGGIMATLKIFIKKTPMLLWSFFFAGYFYSWLIRSSIFPACSDFAFCDNSSLSIVCITASHLLSLISLSWSIVFFSFSSSALSE